MWGFQINLFSHMSLRDSYRIEPMMKRLLPVLAVVFMCIGAGRAQQIEEAGWSRFFPTMPGCTAEFSRMYNNGDGQISQTAQYMEPWVKEGEKAAEKGEYIIVPKLMTGIDILDSGKCGSVSITMFVPVAKRILTKEELQAARKERKKLRKSDNKIEKLTKQTAILFSQAPPPPPRRISVKGFEAYQIYGVPCDYDPCENQFRFTIEVRFAKNKLIRIEHVGNFERTLKIAQSIDYEALAQAMDGH
jgi:hypothetical protein